MSLSFYKGICTKADIGCSRGASIIATENICLAAEKVRPLSGSDTVTSLLSCPLLLLEAILPYLSLLIPGSPPPCTFQTIPIPGSTSPSPMAAHHYFRELDKNKNPAKVMGKKPERGLNGNAVTRAQRLLFTFQALSCTFEQFMLNLASAYLAVTPCTNTRETWTGAAHNHWLCPPCAADELKNIT